MTMSWRKHARCLGMDPGVFHPPGDLDEAAAPALAVCSVCPVREPCLEFAITRGEHHGVWGGQTERDRRRLVRQRRRTA